MCFEKIWLLNENLPSTVVFYFHFYKKLRIWSAYNMYVLDKTKGEGTHTVCRENNINIKYIIIQFILNVDQHSNNKATKQPNQQVVISFKRNKKDTNDDEYSNSSEQHDRWKHDRCR